MIVDKIENLSLYSQIPSYIADFVKTVKKDIQLGKIQLNDSDYVNVESYLTKSHEKCLFESHKNYADIQILILGKERLDFSDKNLKTVEPYNKDKDIEFFEGQETQSVILDGTNFVFLMPEELHRPQMCISEPETVKKMVVKVRIN